MKAKSQEPKHISRRWSRLSSNRSLQGGRNTPHADQWIEVMKATGTFFSCTIFDTVDVGNEGRRTTQKKS